jgi:hypothetical protein
MLELTTRFKSEQVRASGASARFSGPACRLLVAQQPMPPGCPAVLFTCAQWIKSLLAEGPNQSPSALQPSSYCQARLKKSFMAWLAMCTSRSASRCLSGGWRRRARCGGSWRRHTRSVCVSCTAACRRSTCSGKSRGGCHMQSNWVQLGVRAARARLIRKQVCPAEIVCLCHGISFAPN